MRARLLALVQPAVRRHAQQSPVEPDPEPMLVLVLCRTRTPLEDSVGRDGRTAHTNTRCSPPVRSAVLYLHECIQSAGGSAGRFSMDIGHNAIPTSRTVLYSRAQHTTLQYTTIHYNAAAEEEDGLVERASRWQPVTARITALELVRSSPQPCSYTRLQVGPGRPSVAVQSFPRPRSANILLSRRPRPRIGVAAGPLHLSACFAGLLAC